MRGYVGRLLVHSMLALVAACGAETEPALPPAAPQLLLVDQRLEAPVSAAPASLNGQYGSTCAQRTGPWSLGLQTEQPIALDHPPLSVADGDGDCVLTITEIKATDGQHYPAQSDLMVGADYSDRPVAFGDPAVFYVTARITVEVGHVVDLTLVLTDSPAVPMPSPTQSATFPGRLQNQYVPPPDYTLDLGMLSLQTDLHDVVLSVQGSLALVPHAVAGAGYAWTRGWPATYDAIDAAYVRASRPLTNTIASSELALEGTDLTTAQVRTLIIANVVSGIPSYQAFAITFTPQSL